MRTKILISIMILATRLPLFADDDLVWHQECHTIDGIKECAGHIYGCVKFCKDGNDGN